jgi:hypothetical protein
MVFQITSLVRKLKTRTSLTILINNIDFIFLLKLGVTLILMFLVSGLLPLIHHTNRICCKLGGITLPTKIKFLKFVAIVKNSKNILWCKISKHYQQHLSISVLGIVKFLDYFDQTIWILNFIQVSNFLQSVSATCM